MGLGQVVIYYVFVCVAPTNSGDFEFLWVVPLEVSTQPGSLDKKCRQSAFVHFPESI